MSIIVSKDGKRAEVIQKSKFEREQLLQEYIQRNPEAIPV